MPQWWHLMCNDFPEGVLRCTAYWVSTLSMDWSGHKLMGEVRSIPWPALLCKYMFNLLGWPNFNSLSGVFVFFFVVTEVNIFPSQNIKGRVERKCRKQFISLSEKNSSIRLQFSYGHRLFLTWLGLPNTYYSSLHIEVIQETLQDVTNVNWWYGGFVHWSQCWAHSWIQALSEASLSGGSVRPASLQFMGAKASMGRDLYPGRRGRYTGYMKNIIWEVFQSNPIRERARGKAWRNCSHKGLGALV